MQKCFGLLLAVITCLSVGARNSAAQAHVQVPTHAPDGGTRETLISIDVPPKPGAPFSAIVVTEWIRLLEDGTTTTIKNHRLIARDSTGKVFQERRLLTANGDKEPARLNMLEYADPTRHEFYRCAAATHLCTLSGFNRAISPPAEMAVSAALPNGSVTREDLGRKYIANIEVLGSRQITTINPGGSNGYQQPEPTIKEFWYSPQLDVNLITRRFEPRGGVENFTLENIRLSEPDPKLFALPADYKIVHSYAQ